MVVIIEMDIITMETVNSVMGTTITTDTVTITEDVTVQ